MAELLEENFADRCKARLTDAYKDFERTLRIRQAKAGYALALALMPAGITLDWFVYPQLQGKILESRLLCDVALLPCFLLLFTRFGRKFAWLADKPCVLFPAISIGWMIYASQGSKSPYYAGLTLMVIGACLLIPYTLREAAMVCSSILVIYSLAAFFHRIAPPSYALSRDGGSDLRTLFNNIYFLVLTGIICVTACHYSSVRRFADFKLRHDLDVNNTELAATLKKLKETEVQLVQSEKMNALGKLSAGLLHEVNNPLNYTFMALQVAQQEAEQNAELQDTLKDIEEGMSRIRSVISDLRAFAYPSQVQQAEKFTVADALTTALRLTAHELKEIPVDHQQVNGAMAIGSKSQIVHVLMNLLVNSAQALTSKAGEKAPRITISCAQNGPRVEVRVRDNGVGVKATDLPRLFEPFFTTKDVGKGTGLGLSICHTIVQNHGGNIGITSEAGQWTEASFDLPAA